MSAILVATVMFYGSAGLCATLCIAALAYMFYEDFLNGRPPLR